MRGMGRYTGRRYFEQSLGEAWTCTGCGLMVTEGHRCRYRETVQCPDCRAMLLKDVESQHRCPVKIAREKTERAEARRARATERKAAGITSRVKMIRPKEEMQFMEPTGREGEQWTEVTVVKNPWMCRECGLVWQTKHEAENCGFEMKNPFSESKLPHAPSYTRIYGVRYVENGVPKGPYIHHIEFHAIHKFEPDAKPEEIIAWKKEREEIERKREEFLQRKT